MKTVILSIGLLLAASNLSAQISSNFQYVEVEGGVLLIIGLEHIT